METGLEVFVKSAHKKFRKMRLGVLCNQASVDRKLRHVSEVLLAPSLKLNIACFFGPQHGIRGEKQDNMVESEDFIDPVTKKPVYSLYSTTRIPTGRMIEGIDAFIIDLQDIGTRIYTFMYTMANCMKVAAENNKKVIVLDRPNPINGLTLEGNCLEPAFASFVGQYPIIFRHGLTMGELASLFNEEFNLGCDLEIVPLKGWKRNQMADKWGRAWVPPSPNVPNLDSVITFPGTVLFEGTNISEGRGTTKPFEWIGAPYLKPDLLAQHMNSMKFPGVYFRPIFFQPTYQKWKDTVCGGVHIHVSDQKKYSAFKIGIHLLSSMAEMGGEQFQWKKPPYEYENTRMPIDLIAGTDKLRLAIDSGKRLKDLETQSNKDVSAFKKLHKDYCRYKA